MNLFSNLRSPWQGIRNADISLFLHPAGATGVSHASEARGLYGNPTLRAMQK